MYSDVFLKAGGLFLASSIVYYEFHVRLGETEVWSLLFSAEGSKFS